MSGPASSSIAMATCEPLYPPNGSSAPPSIMARASSVLVPLRSRPTPAATLSPARASICTSPRAIEAVAMSNTSGCWLLAASLVEDGAADGGRGHAKDSGLVP